MAKAKKDVKKLIKGISYHNKDILFKILSENYKKKSLKVFGLDLPPIKELLPTNLPVLSLNERRTDNVFLLEDNTVLIVEYESSVNNENLIKYGHYAFRVFERYYKDKHYKVILVVIYTGEIEAAPNFLDTGSIQLRFSQVFLSKFDGVKMYSDLKRKVENNESLTEEDVMKFILLPLTEKIEKQELIEDTINLAKEIKDENTQSFVIAGILSATDKFINKDYSSKIKEWLRMTKIERLFEEEKNAALKEKDEIIKQKEEEKIDALNKLAKDKDKEKLEAVNEAIQETARNMLSENVDILFIMKITGLQKAEILKLKEELIIKE